MRKIKKSLQRFTKVKGAERLFPNSEKTDDYDIQVELIVKVHEIGYVPPDIELRMRIDDTMFTGKSAVRNLANLDIDEKIQSISVTKRLRIIE